MPEANGGKHRYHAEAIALEGSIVLPFKSPIERQAHAKVPEIGGYDSQHAESFRLEGIVSYRAAHTQVSGHKEEKPGHGYITVATSVVENLNVLNVVTADRVVAQVSTEHPLEGYVPTVTFLGTHFYNLRIAGYPIEVELDLDLPCDPSGKVAYTRHDDFLSHVAGRLGPFRRESDDIPAEIKSRYAVDRRETDSGESADFSLVKKIEGSFPGRSFGHVLDIPHFGKVYLATVRIEHTDPGKGKDFHKQALIDLTMIEVKMGCIATGNMAIGSTRNNGSSLPPTG